MGNHIKLAVILISLTILIDVISVQPANSSLQPIILATADSESVNIYFLDVGQGDSILVKTQTKNILIDGGPTDAGNTVVNDLSACNVDKIDLMVATHPHEDHIGGLIAVLQSSISTQDILYNGYNYTTQTYSNWKTLALAHNLTQARRGQVYAMSPTINFTILSPTGPTQFSDLNAESIVMKLQVGNISVMFTGDAQYDSEQSLLSSGYDLHSLILKVGHHGSSTSTSQSFLNAVMPTYAVISAGVNNSYGHPTQQTLSILASNNITLYGTYAYGTITFSLNPTTQPSPTPSSTPTNNPTPTPTVPPTSTAAPTSNPTNSPTVPEFPIIAIAVCIIASVSASMVVLKRNQRRLKLLSAKELIKQKSKK